MKKHFLFAALALLISFTACGPFEPSEPVEPAKISVNPTSINLTSSEEREVTVQSTASWQATVDVDWITFSPKSGQSGSTVVKISCQPGKPGSGTITFSAGISHAMLSVNRVSYGNEHEGEDLPETLTAVDLGLSVKWANMNVGATAPEEAGDYFAWGETQPKETYSWDNYKWGTDAFELNKYNDDPVCGKVDNLTTLLPADDAATAVMGSKWRMPTADEMTELLGDCEWTYYTRNGVKGYKITGPNDNVIFLPAAGHYSPTLLGVGTSIMYWTSTLEPENANEATAVIGAYPNSISVDLGMYSRPEGLPIRAVCK